jgi:Flp pilus assembly protein TadG
MFRKQPRKRAEGQILALFALGAIVIVLAVGLVIDGGNALNQRRNSQNTSDFAALAGARVVAEWIDEKATTGLYVNGTDANVAAAITTSINASGADPITFGAPSGPTYVDANGAVLGYVGTGAAGATPPANTVGVSVNSSRTFRPYFLSVIGVSNWKASSVATARGGYAAGGPGGDVFPAGISLAFFQTYPFCTGAVGSSASCQPEHLTPGNLNVPGGFGWLKFGATGKCTGYGLGMSTTSGCDPNKGFLQTEIGPPPNSFGCCTAVNGGTSTDANPIDRIGSLPGNKASADCSYYINNNVTVTVPIWDNAGGTGDNAWYHIVGFGGFQITNCDGGKDIEGVWRKQFFQGPTTSTPSTPYQSLAVQLIK